MTDQKYMQIALDLAKSTIGQTSPNPSVGAIIVKNGKILAFGAHIESGQNHAEINAINSANANDLIDSTLYVTLEPCCHHGKTSPCTDEIIKHKIKRVVVATLDPNPIIAGAGILQLQSANIEVTIGVLENEAIAINKIFFHYIKTKTPFVTLKMGMSLDAKIATRNKESKWITNEIARNDAHLYRHSHDAILVGVNTIINDNPSLTTRLENGGRNPIRIILDTTLRTPLDAKVIIDKSSKTIIVTGATVNKNTVEKFNKLNIEIIKMPENTININQLLLILGKRNITSILVEGGQTIFTSFIENKQFNEIVTYIAPILIGGQNAVGIFAGNGCNHLSESTKLEFTSIEKLGDNIKIVSQLK